MNLSPFKNVYSAENDTMMIMMIGLNKPDWQVQKLLALFPALHLHLQEEEHCLFFSNTLWDWRKHWGRLGESIELFLIVYLTARSCQISSMSWQGKLRFLFKCAVMNKINKGPKIKSNKNNPVFYRRHPFFVVVFAYVFNAKCTVSQRALFSSHFVHSTQLPCHLTNSRH